MGFSSPSIKHKKKTPPSISIHIAELPRCKQPNIPDAQRAHLVGGWTNPSGKYARQIGSFPQVGVKIKNIWNHHLAIVIHLDPAGRPSWKSPKKMGLMETPTTHQMVILFGTLTGLLVQAYSRTQVFAGAKWQFIANQNDM